MKAFVTGGSGFIGGRIVAKLVEDGCAVSALARSDAGLAKVRSLGATPVCGEINDCAAMRQAMQGCDMVFHVAAWYKVGLQNRDQAEKVNVQGTRNVLELAHQMGVPRIVYTSTVGVNGDTKGRVADESYHYNGKFATEYERTKWQAHWEVAVPLIQRGAPVIIVMPGGVFGPGDHSIIADMMRLIARGRLPAVPGRETTFTYAHVDDIARGHILAADKGRLGETYILAGPAVPMDEFMNLCAKAIGKRPPALKVPSALLRPFWPVMAALERVAPLPAWLSSEATRSVGTTWIASAAKARYELGWETRPLEPDLKETLDWLQNKI